MLQMLSEKHEKKFFLLKLDTDQMRMPQRSLGNGVLFLGVFLRRSQIRLNILHMKLCMVNCGKNHGLPERIFGNGIIAILK